MGCDAEWCDVPGCYRPPHDDDVHVSVMATVLTADDDD